MVWKQSLGVSISFNRGVTVFGMSTNVKAQSHENGKGIKFTIARNASPPFRRKMAEKPTVGVQVATSAIILAELILGTEISPAQNIVTELFSMDSHFGATTKY
jgi:hypothetical protein